MRTWEDNALEFRALIKQGKDIRLALLVACSVEKGKGQNERGSRHNNRYDEKVSAQKFADKAGTSAPRVLRHFDAWEKLAGTGFVPISENLEPDDAATLVIEEPALKAWEGIGLGPTTLTAIIGNPNKVKEALTTNPDFVAKIADSPEVVEAIVLNAIEKSSSGAAIAKTVAKAAPEETAKATANSKKATAAYANVRKKEAEEKKKRLGIKPPIVTPTLKSTEAQVAARNAVSDWLMLIHEAAVKTTAALNLWSKIEHDLISEDLSEAYGSVIQAEGDLGILKSRLADLNNALKSTPLS